MSEVRLVELARERRRGRTSAAESAAAALRELIMEGALPPGTQLSEEALLEPLDISRNTLREAFRLLTHEKLLVHRLNRGVFVRTLDETDIADLYRVRRIIECAALELAGPADIAAMADAVTAGEAAAEQGRWVDVGTANIRFHQAVVASAHSPRIDDLMRQVGAELRLGFHEMGDPRSLHEGYLARNRAIVESLRTGDTDNARDLLRAYLDEAETEIRAAFTKSKEQDPRP